MSYNKSAKNGNISIELQLDNNQKTVWNPGNYR